MGQSGFETRGKGFEVEYFRKKDRQLVDKLKQVFHQKVDKQSIREATGITDELVLDNLVQLNLRGEMMTAFRLFPLVEIAWADGGVSAREAEAVLKAIERQGVLGGSAAHDMFTNALKNGPRPDARKAWYSFAAELRKVLTPEELATFRNDLLDQARKVAEASGGVLNMAMTVSAAERKVLHAVEKALTPE